MSKQASPGRWDSTAAPIPSSWPRICSQAAATAIGSAADQLELGTAGESLAEIHAGADAERLRRARGLADRLAPGRPADGRGEGDGPPGEGLGPADGDDELEAGEEDADDHYERMFASGPRRLQVRPGKPPSTRVSRGGR